VSAARHQIGETDLIYAAEIWVADFFHHDNLCGMGSKRREIGR
jgi:hypothetical protein